MKRIFSRLSLLLVGALLAVATSNVSASTPYSFSDAGAGGAAGVGVFTFDIGAPLGQYHATGVAGDGNTFGPWHSVSFRAFPGTFTSLVISNLVGASVSYSLPAIGGSEVNSDSNADTEWANFLTHATVFPLDISVISSSVPDAADPLMQLGGSLTALGFARRLISRGRSQGTASASRAPLRQPDRDAP